MNEIRHKENLTKIGQQVQNSKTLQELCVNLNKYEVDHLKARTDCRSLVLFHPGNFDFEKLPSFGGAIPHDPNIYSWDETQFLVWSSDRLYFLVGREVFKTCK